MKKRAKTSTIAEICPAFVRERELLLATLDLFDEEELDYRPDLPGDALGPSPREILLHLADSDRRLTEQRFSGRGQGPELICDEATSSIIGREPSDLDRAGIRAQLEASWKAVGTFLEMPAESLLRRVSRENHLSLMGILGYALEHQAQHRGQLWTYLELLGKIPPRD